MKILITEEERENILSQHSEPNKEVLTHLMRHYRFGKIDNEEHLYYGNPYIIVDEKMYFIEDNKKRLVNKIFYEIEDRFKNLDTVVIRQTIKKYLDHIKNI